VRNGHRLESPPPLHSIKGWRSTLSQPTATKRKLSTSLGDCLLLGGGRNPLRLLSLYSTRRRESRALVKLHATRVAHLTFFCTKDPSIVPPSLFLRVDLAGFPRAFYVRTESRRRPNERPAAGRGGGKDGGVPGPGPGRATLFIAAGGIRSRRRHRRGPEFGGNKKTVGREWDVAKRLLPFPVGRSETQSSPPSPPPRASRGSGWLSGRSPSPSTSSFTRCVASIRMGGRLAYYAVKRLPNLSHSPGGGRREGEANSISE